MPLSERARIEIYLPDLPSQSYETLLIALQQELTYAFGGCSVLRCVEGMYLSSDGTQIEDRINVLYADAPFEFERNLSVLSKYADQLQAAAFAAIDEEAVLVVAMKVYHAEY